MHKWLVSLTMVLLISGCGIPTQLRYPPSSPAPDAVRIVKSGGDSNTFFNPSVNTLIQNPQVVTYLFEDLQQMALVRSGPHSCPNDFGTTYTLTFFHGNSKVLTVVADPTGCRDISMNGHAESAMTPSGNPFWETIQTTLRLTSAQLVGERIWVPLSANPIQIILTKNNTSKIVKDNSVGAHAPWREMGAIIKSINDLMNRPVKPTNSTPCPDMINDKYRIEVFYANGPERVFTHTYRYDGLEDQWSFLHLSSAQTVLCAKWFQF